MKSEVKFWIYMAEREAIICCTNQHMPAYIILYAQIIKVLSWGV